jgi:hypothetical protein
LHWCSCTSFCLYHKFLPPFLSQFHACPSFIAIFIVISTKLAWSQVIKYLVNLTGVVQWLRLALSKGPNWVWVFSLLHTRTETDPVSETSCFLFSRIPDDGKSPKTQ